MDKEDLILDVLFQIAFKLGLSLCQGCGVDKRVFNGTHRPGCPRIPLEQGNWK